ncbi:unnamed protein product [Withania somnifera]
MELKYSLRLHLLAPPLEEKCLRSFPSVFGIVPQRRNKLRRSIVSSSKWNNFGLSTQKFWRSQLLVHGLRQKGSNTSKLEELLKFGNGEDDEGDESESDSDGGNKRDDYFHMDVDERQEWRRRIRDVDPVERRRKMRKLLADYPLVVEENDPDWPEDADGRGFNLDQFFNKITIKNVKIDDDENDDSDNELIWQDDDYICPVKDLTTADWEETVFRDIMSRTADELSKMMAFIYYGAAKPPCLNGIENPEDLIPTI